MWRRRPYSVMDLWLAVVLFAWVFDVGLAAVFNGGRFDLGFYAGRVYGLAAASFILVILLAENAMLYGRVVQAYAAERSERQKVQERTAELVAANRELDAFSYSVSHDLRAPLRAIDGYARMLEEDFSARLDDEGQRLLGVVRSSARQMGRLIDDLLEFSRLGRREPAKGDFGMEGLVREVVGQLAPGAPAALIEVGELPAAPADRSLLRQVWLNLIGNAIKYSGRRPDPRIEISGRREPGETVYCVRDNGAGFDMRYAQRLFGVFQRLHSPEEFPGTGIGLALVQRIVVRHGGRVWAEARPGAGAAFHFSLPAS
jgi:light-regulated signal transduction histidine kinase (bacteriophytochrome)